MSCTSTPGNRAVLLVAQHGSEAALPVSTSQAQHAFHALISEGRDLRLPVPDSASVHRWFDGLYFDAATRIPVGRSRIAALRNLDAAWREYRGDPDALAGSTFHAWRHTAPLVAFQRSRERDTGFTVAFDCDGVIYDFNDAMRDWLVARGWNRDAMPEPHTYSLREAWGLDNDDLMKEMQYSVRAGMLWHSGSTHEDGAQSARALGMAGHRILVNTARALPGVNAPARAATMTWLRSVNIHPDGIHVADPADPASKLQADWDVLLDDHPENVRTALNAGRAAILVDRKWNRDATDLDEHRAGFDAIPSIVDNLRKKSAA